MISPPITLVATEMPVNGAAAPEDEGVVTPTTAAIYVPVAMAARSTIAAGIHRFGSLPDSSAKNRSGFVSGFAMMIAI